MPGCPKDNFGGRSERSYSVGVWSLVGREDLIGTLLESG